MVREKFPNPVSGQHETVGSFLEEQGKLWKFSSVRQKLYAIRKIHRLMRLPDPTHDEELNIVLRRIRRSKFSRPKQAKALNKHHRDKFIAALPDTPWGRRDKLMIALGYEILARRSELVAIKTSDITFLSNGTARVIIRRSKADQFGRGRMAFTSTQTSILLEEWIEWRGHDVDYLFCPIYKGIVLDRSLSATTVRRIIKRAAKLSGYDTTLAEEFSGHSMRVGAAQDLLCAGHNTSAIMRAGGWKSVSVLARYLEDAEHNVWA